MSDEDPSSTQSPVAGAATAQAASDLARPESRLAFTLQNAPEDDIRALMQGCQEIIDEAQREQDVVKPSSL